MTAALSIVDAGVRLGGNEILRAVNAEIAPGEFIGVFGPNGAGKSTLIRCILGLTPLCSGRVSVFGTAAGRSNRSIGYMPQSRANLEGTALSARSMVAAVAAGDGWGMPWYRHALREEVERVIELAGVEDYADRPFAVLSGGERQRVGLAQALLGRPQLLLLDEPLASLDPRNQMLLIERVAEIKKATGATILFTAHDVNPLLGVMDRVLYIAGGEAAIGSLDEVITSEELSHLYKTDMRVVRVEGNIFIFAAREASSRPHAMIEQLKDILSSDFVQSALIAGSLAAILGAVVGYFVVIRKVGFAAHALAHVGFTGATGAALFGISPLNGMLAISLLAGAMMGIFGNRLHRSEIAIGMVLSVCLGVGTLFLTLYSGFAGQASAILFGNIFGVSWQQIVQIAILSTASLGTLLLFSRKLLFASVQPDLAEARGVSLSLLSMVFMVILAVSVTLASQVVGILLVFALIIGPAGIAARLFRGFWSGTIASVIIALAAVWSGILLACLTNWPPSFWITAILFILYLIVEIFCRFVLRTER